MKDDHRNTWETYVSSWKAPTDAEKRELFARSLSADCLYTDPLTTARGFDALSGYMADFHRQVPGGHFVTQKFSSHHGKSIAIWEMRDGSGNAIGDGVSYGEYDEEGKLARMTGFFEVPQAS